MEEMSVTALWWAVIFSGLYHGMNPGMGWPLAVSAALMDRKTSALPKALGAPPAHFDLANLHSVSFVLTEDLGVAEGRGFRLLGRGC